jgi:hypothetical protein
MQSRFFSKAALVAVAVMLATFMMGTGAWAAKAAPAKAPAKAAAAAAPALDVKINGSPMCADNQTASRLRLAVRPKADVDQASITVTGGPMVLTNVTGEKGAWIAHLKGPRAFAAHYVTVSAIVSGVSASTQVALPTYVCGPPIPLDAALDGSPECVNDTGTLVRLTLRPKADIDPASVQVNGAPLVLSSVTPGADAWIVTLTGPPILVPEMVTVTATVAGLPQTAVVGIPAATCVHLDAVIQAAPQCTTDGTGTHVVLAVRPKAYVDPASIQITGPLAITGVTEGPDAWLVDLQGPAKIDAYVANVTANVGPTFQGVAVEIPAYWCIPLLLALPAQPHCAGNGDATRVAVALRPKAYIDPTTVTVTGGVMVLTNVDGEANAWIAHLKGPKSIPAQTVTFTAVIGGYPQSASIVIPAYTCTNHDPTMD